MSAAATPRLVRSALAAALACMFAAPAAAAELKLRALLDGGRVVSSTESPANGEARVLLDDDNGVRLDLVYSELDEEPTGAELRVGKPNENGRMVEKIELDVGADVDDGQGRVVGARFDVSADVAERIRAGEAYLVITTIAHPDGVIRGQLEPRPVRLAEPPLADDD